MDLSSIRSPKRRWIQLLWSAPSPTLNKALLSVNKNDLEWKGNLKIWSLLSLFASLSVELNTQLEIQAAFFLWQIYICSTTSKLFRCVMYDGDETDMTAEGACASRLERVEKSVGDVW